MEDRVSAVADNLSLSTMQWAEKKKNEERGMFCGFCRYIDNEDKMLERKRRDATQSQVREREEESANHTTAPSQLPPKDPCHPSQVLSRARPDPGIKYTAPDGRVCRMKRIQNSLQKVSRRGETIGPIYLDIHLPDFHKEQSDPIVVLAFMQ